MTCRAIAEEELIDDELLVTPAPRAVHQIALQTLYRRLDPFVTRHRLGTTFLVQADLDLSRGYVVQPDLFVVPEADTRKLLDGPDWGVPSFIAEILSPSTGRGGGLARAVARSGADGR